MSGSGQKSEETSGFVVSPRMAGIIVIAGVIALPGIPIGYLTPMAIFLGLWTVFVLEARKYRLGAASRQSMAHERLQNVNLQSSTCPEAKLAANDIATAKID